MALDELSAERELTELMEAVIDFMAWRQRMEIERELSRLRVKRALDLLDNLSAAQEARTVPPPPRDAVCAEGAAELFSHSRQPAPGFKSSAPGAEHNTGSPTAENRHAERRAPAPAVNKCPLCEPVLFDAEREDCPRARFCDRHQQTDLARRLGPYLAINQQLRRMS